MIKFHQVTKFYQPDTYALKGVSLHIQPGEFVSIIGQSGSGKTTLVKILIAEEKITQGKITISGWDITNIHHREVPVLRRQIGVIFQDYKLLPQKTVFENIAFTMEAAGRADDDIASDVPYVLELVGLADKFWNFPNQLSGGQQQRVAIARALVTNPKIILADEPTGNLDSKSGQEIMGIFDQLHKEGKTVILITHEISIAKHAKRIIKVSDGRIV